MKTAGAKQYVGLVQFSDNVHPVPTNVVLAEDHSTALAKLARLEAALRLVWIISVRKEVHLGFERPSGVRQHCVPCVCAAALGAGMDSDCVTTEDFVREHDSLKQATV